MSAPALPVEHPPFPAVDAVRDGLARRGWSARLQDCSVRGDDDLRLVVRGSHAPVVEVLLPSPSFPDHGCWQAVRVTRDERTVWSGPPRPCPADELLTFVERLLSAHAEELRSRFQRLG